MTQSIWLPGVDSGDNPWERVEETDPRALAIVDGTHPAALGLPHYSRQTPGAATFTGNGRSIVMVTMDGLCAWSVIYQRLNGYEHASQAIYRFRNNMFRRLPGGGLASELIRSAVSATAIAWRARYGNLPAVALTTEIDPVAVKHKRDPGRCYIRAGWTKTGTTPKGLIILTAPPFALTPSRDPGIG